MNKTINFGSLQTNFQIKVEERGYNCFIIQLKTKYQPSPRFFSTSRFWLHSFHAAFIIVSSHFVVFENWRKVGKL